VTQQSQANRRDFLKAGAASAAAASLAGMFPGGVHAAGTDTIKVGIIGCGGRGTGAGHNVLVSAKNVEIHAVGDAFEDRATGGQRRLEKLAAEDAKVKELGNKVNLTGRVFTGLDAYKQVLDSGVNYIILATPPGFRPLHLQAAVAAGKNIFTEKPVAVDGPGIRKVLHAYEDAKKQKLAIVAGTQRRHQLGYLETMKRLHGGDIGELVGGRCYWNQGILWKNDRKPGMTDLQYQMRNWYGFVWLCGDHIVEQHIHNIDVINWAFQAHPVRAVGMGYRTPRDPGYGHIYNFFAIDFEYPRGVHVLSMCRQISNCANSVSEAVVGTKGTCQVDAYQINGKRVLTRAQDLGSTDPYVQEHTDLIESIRKGEPLNELQQVAYSTLSAIMGRMSAYTGKAVSWEVALNSAEDTFPERLSWDMKLPEPPVALPGVTKLF